MRSSSPRDAYGIALPSRRDVLQGLGAGAAAALAGLSLSARAQSVPSLIVPYSAGGPADAVARQLVGSLRSALARNYIVENVAGVGGALAVQKLLAAPADGGGILFGTANEIVLAPLAVAAVKYKTEELRMIGMANVSPLVLAAATRLPHATLAELIAERRRTPGHPLTMGTAGVGSVFHLINEDFRARTGVPILNVPYKGAAPLMQDLMGGQIDMAFLPAVGSVFDLIRDGRLKAYAVTQRARLERLPTVPSMPEVGLAGFEHEFWGGLFVPRAASPVFAQLANAALVRALQDATVKQGLEASGGSAGRPMTLDEAEQFLAGEAAKYRKLAAAARIQPQ